MEVRTKKETEVLLRTRKSLVTFFREVNGSRTQNTREEARLQRGERVGESLQDRAAVLKLSVSGHFGTLKNY